MKAVCTPGLAKGRAAIALVLGGLLVALASSGVWAATSQTSTTDVSLNVAEAIEVVSWPDSSASLGAAAVPGQASVSAALRFTVKCNSAWGIQVRSDDATGKLREFNVATQQYIADGRVSQQSLEWGLTAAGTFTALSSTSLNIVTNQPASGEIGSVVSLYLRYTPGFNDIPLSADRTYRTVLTYTAAVGY